MTNVRLLSAEAIEEAFRNRYGTDADVVVRAPGRVNLIGEHTDYNDGFVLPMAIDRSIWIAATATGDRRVRLHSVDYDETLEFDLDAITNEKAGWAEYVKGVARMMIDQSIDLRGWQGVVAGDVPQGAGLSSSAALEMGVASVFIEVSGASWDPTAAALIGQRAENEWVGVSCGIMDQMVVSHAREGAALLIDCRSLEVEPVRLPADATVVIMDTGTRRGLVNSEYNLRRRQCEEAARSIGANALRDVDLDTLESWAGTISTGAHRRARHVITENERTLAFARALRESNPEGAGALMNESHESLRGDFEVSSNELDEMVAVSRRQPACFGARMTGAGFGGCAVALVDAAGAEGFVAEVGERYKSSTGIVPQLYISRPARGVHRVNHGFPPSRE